MELMTPSGGTIFWTAVTFVLLLLILRQIAWNPIMQMLEERERKIDDSLAAAEKIKSMSESMIAEQGTIILEARQIAKETVDKATQVAENVRADILKKAEKDAQALVEKTKKDIEASKEKAILEVQQLVVDLSMNATKQIIGKSLDRSDHERLIKDSLTKLGDVN
jgi:F-type H+-transporting ATPase subunit b